MGSKGCEKQQHANFCSSDRPLLFLNYADDRGQTALLCASAGGHEGVVRFLRSRGASLTSEDKDGRTALHAAARYDRIIVVQFLLDAKDDNFSISDPACQDREGNTPLHVACLHGRSLAVRALTCTPSSGGGRKTSEQLLTMLNDAGLSPIGAACLRGQLHAVRGCLAAVPPNVARRLITPSGVVDASQSPLHIAAALGHTEILAEFLKFIDPETNEIQGESTMVTPLELALHGNHGGCVNLLRPGAAVATESSNDPNDENIEQEFTAQSQGQVPGQHEIDSSVQPAMRELPAGSVEAQEGLLALKAMIYGDGMSHNNKKGSPVRVAKLETHSPTVTEKVNRPVPSRAVPSYLVHHLIHEQWAKLLTAILLWLPLLLWVANRLKTD